MAGTAVTELIEVPLVALSELIRSGEVSPVDIAASALRRLEQWEPHLHAFATVTAELCVDAARVAEAEILAGDWRGPLHGIPVGVKDLFDTAGVPTEAGSAVRAGNIPRHDAAAVARLRAAGMPILGKTTTHEFAHGGTTPGTANPWDLGRIPGGSSGGSGAAVGAGIVHVALGTDTAGSVRIPAALCGTVGLKPTYGRVSRFGLTPLSWSLDHIGVLTRSVADAALLLAALAGADPRDPTTDTVGATGFEFAAFGEVRGLRVGVPASSFGTCDPEVEAAVLAAASELQGSGAELIEIAVPEPELIGIVEWTLLTAEASAYQSKTMRRRPDLFGDDVRMLNEAGEAILATDYINALRLRTHVRATFAALFREVDVLLLPTVSTTATTREDPFVRWPDGTVEGASDAYTRFCILANVTGLPALQLPVGRSTSGLPLGVQLLGRPCEEQALFTAGTVLENAFPWSAPPVPG
ncbi:amidase [Microbacterium maritypicum]|uniref:amidase n=1 Tax=Microbacterium maritypicum TaxID=33918 RepID=UPI0037F6655F